MRFFNHDNAILMSKFYFIDIGLNYNLCNITSYNFCLVEASMLNVASMVTMALPRLPQFAPRFIQDEVT